MLSNLTEFFTKRKQIAKLETEILEVCNQARSFKSKRDSLIRQTSFLSKKCLELEYKANEYLGEREKYRCEFNKMQKAASYWRSAYALVSKDNKSLRNETTS